MTTQNEIRNIVIASLKERPMTRYELQKETGLSFYCIKNNIEYLERLKVIRRKTVKIKGRAEELCCYTPDYWKRLHHTHKK